ncbi:MarR family winged helix-turn-helix transcriptional regulator [Biostraticola tofi]|uniref:DNA-binding MarR family transcriptional regulator n=1 Tax=Biostraticola tofi TaxID=466109 RepID=A0A4R3Z3Q2_9GAMM|nr:MarR family transcriptional regulator [Biostraticola tofi]TCW00464.1 DNA-binding MarR family transcriptional regulator [Biostraticola tofi]
MTHFLLADLNAVHRWGRQIHQLNAHKDRLLEHYLIPYAITAAQCKVLLLMSRDGVSTSADLSRCLVLDSGAMSRMLDRLENKKLITRERCPTDRRQMHIKLTSGGQDFCRHIPEVVVDTFNDLLAPLTPAERNELDRLLTKLVTHHTGI